MSAERSGRSPVVAAREAVYAAERAIDAHNRDGAGCITCRTARYVFECCAVGDALYQRLHAADLVRMNAEVQDRIAATAPDPAPERTDDGR